MECLTEFACSVYVDGEMPEPESREIESHLTVCASCRDMVLGYREESRLLVHYVQEIDAKAKSGISRWNSESVPNSLSRPDFAHRPPRRADVAKFGGVLLGLATLVQLAMSSPENLDWLSSPVNLDWLNPSNLAGRLNLLIGSVVYVALEGGSKLMSLIGELSGLLVLALIVAGVLTVVKRSARKGAIVAMLGALALVVSTLPGYGMDFRAGENRVVTIPASETIDDNLFVTGESIVIDGTVNGDLLAFARQVIIHGLVKGNVITGAQSIEITGDVEGTIISAAQTIQINGKVSRNVAAIGQSVMLGKDTIVNGDASVFAGEAHLNGVVKRSFYAVGFADISGTVGRNVNFRGATITLLPTAHIAGDMVSHVARADAVHIIPGAIIGGRQSVEIEKPGPSRYKTKSFYFWELVHLIEALITGIIVLLLFPRLRQLNFSDSLTVLKSAGLGFLIMVATPFAALILMITLIGFPVALIGTAAWLLGLYLAKILVANYIGRTLLLSDMNRFSSVVLSLLVGLVLVFTAINLPYVGWLVHFLLVIIGFGALILTLFHSLQPSHDFGR